MFYLVKTHVECIKVFILFPFLLKATGKTQGSIILLPWLDPRYFISFEAQISNVMLTIFWHQIQTVNLATYISSSVKQGWSSSEVPGRSF